MLHVVGVLVFVIGSAKCAIRLLDPPSFFYDSQFSPSFTSLESLDPRNQAVSSSYSIVETSGGSQNPSRAIYTKTEFKPEGQYSEHKAVNERRLRPKFEDDSSSSEYVYDDPIPPRRPASRLRTKESRQNKVTRAPKISESSSTSPPKSINEIVEKVAPLEEAGSAKSGKFLGSGGVGDSYEEGYDREKHYDKEGGKKFVEAHKNEGGEKAHKAYKEEKGYDKGEKEAHGKEEQKKVFSHKEGEKKGHLDEEKHRAEQHKGKHLEKGLKASNKKGHDRNHKKKSYHKVHNKNEFKLDEEISENSHDGADHEEHLEDHEKLGKEEAGAAKKDRHDSAFHEAHGKKEGLQDKGAFHEQAAGHEKKAGEQEHHDEHSEYDKKGGVKEGTKYGHAEGGGHGGGYFDHGGF